MLKVILLPGSQNQLDTFMKTSIEIVKLAKLLRFLIEFAYFNEDALMNKSIQQAKPDDQIVFD